MKHLKRNKSIQTLFSQGAQQSTAQFFVAQVVCVIFQLEQLKSLRGKKSNMNKIGIK